MILFLTSVMVALTVSFLCSLMEATLLSLTPSQTAEIAITRPRLAQIWQGFKTNIDRPIAVILILNTAAHTIGASVAGAQFNSIFGDDWLWVFSLVFTFLMLQFTEILPKTLGVRFNRELAVVIAAPLSTAVRLTTPVLRLIQVINRPLETDRPRRTGMSTVDEIATLAGLARLSNQIGPHQERIIKAATRLSMLRVRQVMLPVEQVSFLSTTQTLMDAIATAHIDSHTRFPVCENGDRDRVVGYINFKEMVYYMRTNPVDPTLRGIIRPIHFASPDDSAADLLRTFVDQHIHLAIVRDKHGKTVGFITMEDLVEELVGDVEDEFDRLPRMLHQLSGGVWMVGGGVPVVDLMRQTQQSVSDWHNNVDAWLRQRLNRMPKPGDIYREGDLEFTIRRVRRGKVFEAAVSRARAS